MKTKADEELDRRIRVDWEDISKYNAGRPGFECEIATSLGADTKPGIVVSYGQRNDKKWIVRIDMIGDASRYSITFDNESSAKVRAKAIVRALRALWPEVTP